MAADVLPFLTAAPENAALTGSLLAKSRQLWPVTSRALIICEDKNDPGHGFAVCGADDAIGRRTRTGPGFLRHARHHGRWSQFPWRRQWRVVSAPDNAPPAICPP